MWPLLCTPWLADWAVLLPPSLTCLEDLLSLFSHLVPRPIWGNYIWWELSWGDPFLFEATQDCCTQWRPYGERVWMTLNLAERWWWLSHCKYWSVCVGFLYTVMDREPSASGLTIVSKKGMETILLVVLYCKPNGRVNTVYVLEEALFVDFLVDDKSVIHIPAPELRGWGQYLELFVPSTPCISWLQWG